MRWVPAIGLAQLVYSAVDFRLVLARDPARYLIHVAGEGLLLAVLVAAGLTYAAATRRTPRGGRPTSPGPSPS
ncbi:hypothetical protein [Microbispora sp. H10949]|uniref:hypothetical protein n=1 Tax=Microbispora sp. H10949 TaxID=2729111 RepID=UPI001603BB7C|nr:hypothetical protein [Microbispora sp. H10949]